MEKCLISSPILHVSQNCHMHGLGSKDCEVWYFHSFDFKRGTGRNAKKKKKKLKDTMFQNGYLLIPTQFLSGLLL